MAACPPVRWLGVVRWLAVDRIAVADRVGTATYAPAMAVAAIPLMSATLPELAARGVVVPVYDRRPFVGRIVHIGVGGFHRSHMARYTHELLEETASAHDASSQWAITGLGLLPGDAAMAAALDAQDGLYTLIERGAGEPTVTVIGSIVGYHHAAGRPGAAIEVLAAPEVAIISMTITEAGYASPATDGSTFDVVARALARRRATGVGAVTILSCDNLPGNGAAARRATLAAAERLDMETPEIGRSATEVIDRGMGDPRPIDTGLAAWIDQHCSFPNSMVDRITPTTSAADRQWLAQRHGIADRWPVVAESFRQWVVEDRFVAGRPGWERVGALFTDDVEAWELYKLRMLNAAHSAMAYLCALAGVTYVDEAIALTEVRTLLTGLLHDEAIPTLAPIPGHPPGDYAATVLERFANPGVRDQIARLCVDGAAKFPTFLVPTIEACLAVGRPVGRAALALAGWVRYLGVVPVAEQAADPSADAIRPLAAAAVDDPARFLDADVVITEPLRASPAFRDAFVAAYRRLVDVGPLAAMAAASARA